MRYPSMRTAGLFTPVALLSLHVLSAHAEPLCHTDHPLSSAELSTAHISNLQAALGGEVAEFCSEALNTNSKDTFVHKVDGVTFQITGRVTQSVKECTASFAAIIAQCYVDQSIDGGELQSGGEVTYEVYHDDSEYYETLDETTIDKRDFQTDQDDMDDLLHMMGSSGLERRAGTKKPAKPPAAAKPPVAPKPPTTPAKPPKTPVNPPAVPAKPPVNKPGSTPSPVGKPKPTPTPSPSPKPVPAKTCKQIYDIAIRDVKAEALELQQEETRLDGAAIAGRDLYVGSITSRRMLDLEKRATKPGSGCGFKKFNALDYPESGNMPAAAKFYHLTDPTACDALAFSGATKEARGLTRADYQIEHVLEWQVVTKFFEWVQTKKGAERFDNPDPKQKGKLAFCPYWRATWEGAYSPVFKLNPDDKKELNAIDHLKYAYPGKGNFEEEFVWLQTAVNSPAKAQMWTTKTTPGVYGDKTRREVKGKNTPDKISTGMTDLIVGTNAGKGIPQTLSTVDSARQAYFKLKWLLAARLYVKNPEIKAIFKKQKERIGDVLDLLDTEMEKQPKTKNAGVVMGAWKKQGLKALWDEYMEEKFKTAKSRSEHDMDKYLRLMEGKWSRTVTGTSENDRLVFALQVKKLKAAWAAEKNSWTAPWS